MKACGIVAEYNPFHNGHLWQMQQAKKKSAADVVVVVMSGNFLQRGEPAIVDKWKRAEMALAAGADLVVELPFAYAVQAADFFAKGAVSILHALNCSSFSFGAESGTDSEYKEAGHWYHENKSRIDRRMQELKNEGASYPVQMEKVMRELIPSFSFELSSPNNQLGFAYAKENATYDTPMELHVIPRRESHYHDTALSRKSISSATSIRRVLLQKEKSTAFEEIASYLPATSMETLTNTPFVNWENYWLFLKYQLMVKPIDELKNIYQMNEGLEHRLKKNVEESRSFNEFLSKVKTKRFTWTRLQRIAAYTLLQVQKSQMESDLESVKAVRVLGFSTAGQMYLSEQKKSFAVSLVTNIHKQNQSLFQRDLVAGKVYRLPAMNAINHQDFKRSPIRYKK